MKIVYLEYLKNIMLFEELSNMIIYITYYVRKYNITKGEQVWY